MNIIYLKKHYLILLLILFFSFIYSSYSIIRHLTYNSLSYDLGIYDQMIYLGSRLKPLYSTIMDVHVFGDHFTISLLFLTPIFWIWNNVIALLIFQAFFACFGALPIYLLALKKFQPKTDPITWRDNNKTLSLLIGFSYLAFFGMQSALAYDFHPIVLGSSLLSWMLYLHEVKKIKLFWLALVIFLGLQENMALFGIGFGGFLMVKGFLYSKTSRAKEIIKGLKICVISLVWFLIVTQFIIPNFSKSPYLYTPNYLFGKNMMEILKMLITPIDKIYSLIILFLAFGFLAIFYLPVFIIVFEEIIQRFIGTPFGSRWSMDYQYNIILAPILAFSSIEIIKKYLLNYKKLTYILILTGLIMSQIFTKPNLKNLFNKSFYDFSKAKAINNSIKLIPPDVVVAATNNIGPHLTHSNKVILLTNCQDDETLWRDQTKRCFKLKPDYIIADLDPKTSIAAYFPDYSREKITNYLNYLLQNKKFILLEEKNNIILLKKVGE